VILNTEQTSWESGEVDPTLHGRSDLRAYAQGAKRMRNTARLSTGGFERRGGTYDLASLPARARMAEFEFSDTQRYVLAFSSGTVGIYDLGGGLLQTIVGCPWNETRAFEMTYSQSGDVMVICHQEFPPQLLKRTGATTFVLEPMVFDVSIDSGRIYQPYFKFDAPNLSIEPSASTGTITVEASASLFDASVIGQRWRVFDTEIEFTAVTDALNAEATVIDRLIGKLDLDPLKSKAGTVDIEVLHFFHGLETGATITLSGCNSVGFIPGDQIDGAHVVKVLDEIRYQVTLTGVSFDYDHDGDSTTAPIPKTAAVTSEDGGGANVEFEAAGTKTRSWTEPAISARRGYPGACCFHEQRLWLAGTPSQPDACFGSKSLLPFNFDVGKGYDGDSVQVSSGTEDVSRIFHIVSNGELAVLTATRESIFITREGEAITPNNARIKGQDSTGSANIQPVVFDGAVLFVQENRKSVSEFVFASNERTFRSVPVSTLATHLIRHPTTMAVSQGATNRSEQLAFLTNADGTCSVFHSMRSENIAGWGLWTLGAGTIESVCAVGPYVYFAVEVRGAHRLYRVSDDDMGCLDGQVKHVADTAITSWVLDPRVRGRAVGVRSELGYHGVFDIPADGALELTVAVKTLVAGDPFFYEVEMLPPIVELPNGKRTGQIKRIVSTTVLFDETYSTTVGGTRVETRLANEDRAAPITPVTGAREITHLGFSRTPTTVLSQTEPLPARVLSALQKVKV